MAASSRPPLVWTEPCVKLRKVSGCAVPKPTWVSPRPDPIDCVTRSRKLTLLPLKPGVLRFARLLPTTSTAVAMALSAESADENEPGILISCRVVLSWPYELLQFLADSRHIRAQ